MTAVVERELYTMLMASMLSNTLEKCCNALCRITHERRLDAFKWFLFEPGNKHVTVSMLLHAVTRCDPHRMTADFQALSSLYGFSIDQPDVERGERTPITTYIG